jgi:uncharacterized protein (UPF0332 family)
MPKILTDSRLVRITTSKCVLIKGWAEGVSLQVDAGCTITELLTIVAADRWKLAYEHRKQANRLFKTAVPYYRGAISRYYYSMYNAMRACAFIYFEGNDHEKHSDLPGHIPPDCPSNTTWQTKLKDAREVRNRADYDPYPKAETNFLLNCHSIKTDADQLIIDSRNYLRGKGCPIKLTTSNTSRRLSMQQTSKFRVWISKPIPKKLSLSLKST